MIATNQPTKQPARPAQGRAQVCQPSASRPATDNMSPAPEVTPHDPQTSLAVSDAAEFKVQISIGHAIDLRRLAAQLDFVIAGAVLPELRAASKEAAIRALVDRLAEVGAVPAVERDEVFAAVLRGESISPTAIGHGVAIPHAKHRTVRRVVAAVALCPDGVRFGGCDGLAVQLIILLVSPEGDHAAHLDALRRLSQHLLAAADPACR